MDQLRAVVDRNDFDARGKAGLDVLDASLDALGDIERILTAAHDDDTRDDVAGAIEVGDAAAKIGAFDDFADILDAHWRSVLRRGECDVAEVLKRSGVDSAANHVFGPAEVKHAGAGFGVTVTYGVRHLR